MNVRSILVPRPLTEGDVVIAELSAVALNGWRFLDELRRTGNADLDAVALNNILADCVAQAMREVPPELVQRITAQALEAFRGDVGI